MILTKLPVCFQCPNCHSFDSHIKNIRATELESHIDMYRLNIDFKCCNCGTVFSHKFTVSADEDNLPTIEYLTGKEKFPTKLCFCTKFDGRCDICDI